MFSKQLAKIAACSLPVMVLAAACTSQTVLHPSPTPSETRAHAAAKIHWYNGVAVPKATALGEFVNKTGEKPDIVQVYLAFGKPFPTGEIKGLVATGAMPLIQWNPRKVPVGYVAGGAYDEYLKKFAASIAKFGHEVGLSFGHEMNGNWYVWGCTHTPPKVFVAAWDHIHKVMGTKDIKYVWTIDHANLTGCPLHRWFPGDAEIDWVGIDGYLRTVGDTFQTILDPAVKRVNKLTNKPIIMTEVGVPLGPGVAARIGSLFTGAKAAHNVMGLVYFDSKTSKGDYRPQDDPTALKAFKQQIDG